MNKRTCNCIREKQCPMHDKCLANNILYTATFTSSNKNYETAKDTPISIMQM